LFLHASPTCVWACILTLIRSEFITSILYHLLWFVLIAIGVTMLFERRRKQVTLAFSVPLVLLLAVGAKNYFLFGDLTPGTQAFQSANYAILNSQLTPPSVIQKLIDKSKTTRVLQMPPYLHKPQDYRWRYRDAVSSQILVLFVLFCQDVFVAQFTKRRAMQGIGQYQPQ
jgi:hypothetical protein